MHGKRHDRDVFRVSVSVRERRKQTHQPVRSPVFPMLGTHVPQVKNSRDFGASRLTCKNYSFTKKPQNFRTLECAVRDFRTMKPVLVQGVLAAKIRKKLRFSTTVHGEPFTVNRYRWRKSEEQPSGAEERMYILLYLQGRSDRKPTCFNSLSISKNNYVPLSGKPTPPFGHPSQEGNSRTRFENQSSISEMPVASFNLRDKFKLYEGWDTGKRFSGSDAQHTFPEYR